MSRGLTQFRSRNAILAVARLANCDIQLQNVAPDDGLKSPKHVERLMINKDSL
jgi:hypothetical protein